MRERERETDRQTDRDRDKGGEGGRGGGERGKGRVNGDRQCVACCVFLFLAVLFVVELLVLQKDMRTRTRP